MKKVLIASIDAYTKEIIRSCVKQAFPKTEIIDVTIDNDVLYHVKSADDGIILFDKYFLSYVLKFKILSLRNLNRRLRIIFCESGDCSRFFGLRLYKLGVDGFVANIEKEQNFITKLRVMAASNRFFPQEVVDCINENQHLLEHKCCGEITEKEFEIAIKLGQGKSMKEICDETTSSISSVGTHIHWLKKKIGYKSMKDFTLLNQQMERMNIRSWVC